MLQIRPAALSDIPSLRKKFLPHHFSRTVWHFHTGLTWLLVWQGEVVGAFGLVPCGDYPADELWFMTSWKMAAAKDKGKFVRALIKRWRGQEWQRPVLAAVVDGHRSGETLAKAMGFVKSDRIGTVEPAVYHWVFIPNLTVSGEH